MHLREGQPRQTGTLGFSRLAELLGRWQASELRTVRAFRECHGLSDAQLEDLYQDTALALLSRHYASEQHLRNALRHGIRHRALNMHRDQRRRSEILAEHAPEIQHASNAGPPEPEEAVLAQHDRLIAKEFLADLDPLEREVFRLTADGLRYRAIATALDIPARRARAAARSCERKRARFQLLYETGRLCGYRAATIEALERNGACGLLEAQAQAHLAACRSCRKAQRAPAGVRRGASVFLAVALPASWRWARRLGGSGGLAAKGAAVTLTAAVLAGGALSGGQHHAPRPGPRQFPDRRTTSRGTRAGRKPGRGARLAPERYRPARRITPAGRRAVADATIAWPEDAGEREPETLVRPGGAEREFGPER